ncbi:3-hydroxy-3-methylglutaryl-coenzyme A reductase [Staphylococcus aureus]|nr:3-hydroxy-3-methylglutaryl-coenzyme A reductase [Staphylococcus aureus]
MSLQYKSLAIVVGAKGDEIAKVAEALKKEPRANTQAAERILQDLRSQQ